MSNKNLKNFVNKITKIRESESENFNINKFSNFLTP